MNEITLNEIYQVITSQTSALIQNNSKVKVELFVTDGAAPLKENGIILNPGLAILRQDIPSIGTLYARSQGQGSVIISE
jgi:hypothetical protein